LGQDTSVRAILILYSRRIYEHVQRWGAGLNKLEVSAVCGQNTEAGEPDYKKQ